MVFAPGHVHLKAIKILHLDSFLANVPGSVTGVTAPQTLSGHTRNR
jgi:hypothetical protein